MTMSAPPLSPLPPASGAASLLRRLSPFGLVLLILTVMTGVPAAVLWSLRINGEPLLDHYRHVQAREATLMVALRTANPVWGPKATDPDTVRRTDLADTLRTLVTFPGHRFVLVNLDSRLVDVAYPLNQWQDALRLQRAAGTAPAQGGLNASTVRTRLDQDAPGLAAQLNGLALTPWCEDCESVRTQDGTLLGLDLPNRQVWVRLRLDQIDAAMDAMRPRDQAPRHDMRLGFR